MRVGDKSYHGGSAPLERCYSASKDIPGATGAKLAGLRQNSPSSSKEGAAFGPLRTPVFRITLGSRLLAFFQVPMLVN